MDNLSYPAKGKLTFHKNKFSPQWRFLIHTLLHCLSTKSGSWDQFGNPLAISLICLCEGKKYNWSRYIFTGMTDHETVTEPVHPTASPRDHGSSSPRPTLAAPLSEPVSTPPRPIPTSPSAQVNQPGPSSDPHVESSLKDNAPIPDPKVADDPLGGSFFASPSRSTAAPPDGPTSGGVVDPPTLTALYTLVSEQGKRIGCLESELQAH
ncbi:hypothetical protein Tco_0112657, partial [Tanacetum coccineum]